MTAVGDGSSSLMNVGQAGTGAAAATVSRLGSRGDNTSTIVSVTSVAPRKTIGRSPRALWRWPKRSAKAFGLLRGRTLLLAYGMAVWGVLTDRSRRATRRSLR